MKIDVTQNSDVIGRLILDAMGEDLPLSAIECRSGDIFMWIGHEYPSRFYRKPEDRIGFKVTIEFRDVDSKTVRRSLNVKKDGEVSITKLAMKLKALRDLKAKDDELRVIKNEKRKAENLKRDQLRSALGGLGLSVNGWGRVETGLPNVSADVTADGLKVGLKGVSVEQYKRIVEVLTDD